MVTRRLCAAVLAPVFALVSCAPGRGGGGGIGCSTTSSVLKAPQIRTSSEISNDARPSEEITRSRVIRLFGSENAALENGVVKSSRGGLNTSGGYIFIKSREKADPLGLKKTEDGKIKGQVSRCSVLVEYPKNTGETKPPGTTGSNFPVNNADSYRFPSDGDPLNIRIYTAAHCLDYSINESIELALFKGVQDISSPSKDYLSFKINVPEIEAVKELRKSVKAKIKEGRITEGDGIKVLNAFRPATYSLTDVFGTDTSTSSGRCTKVPTAESNSEQYSCATYHDMAVLDVTLAEGIDSGTISAIKELRQKWVENIKAEEGKGPWTEYVKPIYEAGQFNNLRVFVDQLLGSADGDSAKASNSKCATFSSYDLGPPCVSVTCTPEQLGCVPFTCPTQTTKTTKLGLFHPTPENCLELSIDSPNKLSFMRYITRERLRTFSRYNMAAKLTDLAVNDLSLQQCSSGGLCDLKSEIDAAIAKVVPDMNISKISEDFQKNYKTATQYVDASLSSWKPFLDSVKDALKDLDSSGDFNAGGQAFNLSSQKELLQKIINPIDFLKLHSNFLIKEDVPGNNDLPDATDNTTPRAFMLAPMHNIVGLKSYFENDNSFNIGLNDSNLPVEILPWGDSGSAGNGFGKFLKIFVTKSSRETYFTDALKEVICGKDEYGNIDNCSAFNDNVSLNLPNFFEVDDDTLEPQELKPFETLVYLQKGDSGSIFTLDSVPMFALSVVNGEATSGGAQLAARSHEFEDTDDVMPVGPGDGGGGGGGPSVVANTCK